MIAETALVESPTGRMIQELRVAIDNVQPDDVLNADVSGTNISMDYRNGVLTLTGAAVAETYQQVLQTVTFENTSEAPSSVQRTISYQVTDTEGRTDGETALANVVPVNDAPINELPGQIVAPANTPIDINNISIRDVDVGDGQVLVTLRSDFGVIQVAGDGSGAEINNNGGSIVTVEGTVTQVNAALQGLTYAPLTDFSGEDRLTITVNDQGFSGVHPINNVQPDCSGLIGIELTDDGQVPPFPNEGTPQDPTALEDQDVIIIQVTETDINVVPEIPGTPDVPFLPITRPEGRDIDGIALEAVRLPGPVGITEGVGRPLFEARALAGRDFYDFCSIEESLRSHLGCRFANTRDPEAQFGSITWEDFTDLGWIPPYEHLDEEYDLYSQLFLREQGDPGFNVQANAFQRDLGGMTEQPREVFEEKAGKEGFNELDPGEVKRTFFAGREHLDKTGR
ncbi:MAG: Ig-like domain-containing protein [Thermodesulfobacteriota bacterium]